MMTDLVVDLPVRTVYDQWTQFEDFPLFMDHVKEVEQIDDTHLRWKASISGIRREWEAEITEQSPNQRVAWTSIDGTGSSGVVTFHPLDDDHTKVVLQLEMHPEGLLEHIADKGGYVSDRARKDLEGFKEFIEHRGRATGAWRGEVEREPDRGRTTDRARLESKSKDELYDMARDRDIGGRSNMTKDELVEALLGR